MQTSSSVSLNFNPPDTDSCHALSSNHSSITFRFLHPGDQTEVKSLCHDWFPIKYPDQWYDDIVHDQKYFALAACDTSTKRIIALIVANILPLRDCNHEDQQILHHTFLFTTSVCYILVLGVMKEYRRQGLASILLENLCKKLSNYQTCKAIYLHVLYSNKQAIGFYQSKLFQYRFHLPYYYFINDEHFDAYCFARYINGGYPPLSIFNFFSNIRTYLIRTNLCRVFHTVKYFVIKKLIFINYYQRSSSYKQISRVI